MSRKWHKFMGTCSVISVLIGMNNVYAQSEIWATNSVNPLNNNVQLFLDTNKKSYLPGEPVKVKMRLKNISAKPIKIYQWLSEDSSLVSAYVSKNQDQYKRYKGWNEIDIAGELEPKILNVGAELVAEEELLYSPISHSSYINKLDNAIETFYALPTPGSYKIKVIYDQSNDSKYFDDKVEAEVSIQVEVPQGTDASLWQALKDNPEYAFFLHRHVKPSGSLENVEEFVEPLENLTLAYSESRYVTIIRNALDQYYKKYGLTPQLRVEE